MKIATWNVNSVRARLERLTAWLAREAPDVLCLQETKATDDAFPFDALREAGYHAAVHGQKTYNGVAVLSRTPAEDVAAGLGDGVDDPQARFLAARVGGVHVLSAYVPNGQTVGGDGWAYKLDWLARLRAFLARRYTPADPVVLCGDLNVAPDDADVAFPERWRGTVLFHPEARGALREVVAWGLEDVVRRHHDPARDGAGPFTWWDYRSLAFPRGDGLRIDHVYATPVLAARSTAAYVDREERKGDKPSDHAPVVAVFGAG